jgi:hypothetical protein
MVVLTEPDDAEVEIDVGPPQSAYLLASRRGVPRQREWQRIGRLQRTTTV